MLCCTRNASIWYPSIGITCCLPDNSKNSISNGRSGAMTLKDCTTRSTPFGPMINNGSVRSAIPSVSKRPGSQLIWSARKCVKQMASRGFTLHPRSLIATCVPSPQSISTSWPLNLVMHAVSFRYGRGIMPPVPNKHTSNILHPFSKSRLLSFLSQKPVF